MTRSKLAQFKRSVRQSLIEDFNMQAYRATTLIKQEANFLSERHAACYTVHQTARTIFEMKYHAK